MDFLNRNQQSNGRSNTVFSAGAPNNEGPAPAPEHEKHHSSPRSHHGGENKLNKWIQWAGGAGVIVVAVLLAAIIALLLNYKPASEAELVNPDKLQAVFLTNDQVYFGDITALNSRYMVLANVYYLQSGAGTNTNTNASASNVSLVKLGCELHKPQDAMVISRDQINFWENLQDDGQVAKAVKSYADAHPNGQTCDEATTTAPVQGSSQTVPTTNNTTSQSQSNDQTTDTKKNNN